MADVSLPTVSRRSLLWLLATAALSPVLSACGNSLGTGSGGDVVRVGLVIPQSGVYAALGTDLQRGWELWLDQHDGKLGPFSVQTVVVDDELIVDRQP